MSLSPPWCGISVDRLLCPLPALAAREGAELTIPAGETGLEILADNDVTTRILDIVRDAKRFVVLVSPYVDRVGHVEHELQKAQQNGVKVLVVVRHDGNTIGGSNSQKAQDWFNEHDIPVQAVPDLHAKFYLNEKQAVVTSMNLLRSSWSGSLELGVPVTGEAHKRLTGYLRDHLRGLAEDVPKAKLPTGEDTATRAKPRSTTRQTARARPKAKARRATRRAASSDESKPEGVFGALGGLLRAVLGAEGYCIRCRSELNADQVDAGNVLCDKCYRQWTRYKNPNFTEKYCTTCGSAGKTSYSRPQCADCYDG